MAASANNIKSIKRVITKKPNNFNIASSSNVAIPVIDFVSIENNRQSKNKIDTLYTNDNYVFSKWRAQPAVCHFLIHNAFRAMLSTRANIIFSPFPESWLSNACGSISTNRDSLELLEKYDIKQLVKDHNIIIDFDTVVTMIRESYNDAEMIERLNCQTYELIRFILEGCKILIKADNLLSTGDIIPVQTKNQSLSIQDKDILEGVRQFKVEHTAIVEDRFLGRDTVYLYHGSRIENWYSIMANGIKIGSKSKYFLNGAAYGNGIYLSNDINLSLGYSGAKGYGSVYNPSTGNTESEYMILAIFQVINNPRWHKCGNIFVVDDENALVLRYLLVFNDLYNPILQGIFKAINIKLNSGGIQATEKQKTDMAARQLTTIHNKRLMFEYKAIMKQQPEVLGFHIRLTDEDQLGKWMIYLTRVDNPRLQEQMSRLAIHAIEIEITFKESYPIAPPFIRIVYPHFKFHSGHITVGGSLCMEMLTNQGWSPTFNVENVITQIKMAIADGSGEIDEANYKKRYTMDEALEAFKRVMSAHGWV